MLHAYCEANVPKIAIVLRKAYGGAYPTLANAFATDFIFALSQSEIAVMGPEGVVSVIFKRELESAGQAEARRLELIEEYRDAHASSMYSARKGHIDNIIAPQEVRNTLISSFDLLAEKYRAPRYVATRTFNCKRYDMKIPRFSENDYSTDAIATRLHWLEDHIGRSFLHLAGEHFPTELVNGTCENVVGFVGVPVSVAGPR